jgi:hypothetical protein
MPFPQQSPRQFTRAKVEAITPGQYGVYGLCNSGGWIYVGKGDIRSRLLAHLNGDNACISRQRPTHWVDEVTSDMDRREKQQILELNPLCNKKVG